VGERWATFDCYGTLVDWNGGIRSELARLFGSASADSLLDRYHELEREIQSASPEASYREVLTCALERLASEEGVALPEAEAGALARSLSGWPVFPDVRSGLERARERGWRLAILSNTDRDLIDASLTSIGVPFELAIVAGEIGSYKPAHRHWEVFRETTGADPARHVHVAQSVFHDIAPAEELGLRSIWINRQSQPPDPRPARTLPDLGALADALDELVPPSPLSDQPGSAA
jgi:2-haloacid dehalogenase